MCCLFSSGIVCPADVDMELFSKIKDNINWIDLVVKAIEALCQSEPVRPGRKGTSLFETILRIDKEEKKSQ